MNETSTPLLFEDDPKLTIGRLLADRVAATPERVIFAVPDGDGWCDITAREFERQVIDLAKGFAAAGVEPGDRIGLCAQTSYEWSLIDFAAIYAGAVVVPIYETSSTAQAEWIIADSELKFVITGEAKQAKAIAGLSAEHAPKLHWRLDEGAIATLSGSEDAKAIADDEIIRRRDLATGDDIATIIYTSGSTGRPKGTELTHRNFAALSRNAGEQLAELVRAEDCSTVLFITLAHVFARFISVMCVDHGVRVGHQSDTSRLMESLASFHPSFLLAVPRVFEKVYNASEAKADASGKGAIFRRATTIGARWAEAVDTKGRAPLWLTLQEKIYDALVFKKLRDAMGGRVRFAVSGSAPLGKHLSYFFRAIGINILEGYGLTETTAPVTVNLPRRSRVGTVGPALPGTSVRIDPEDHEILVKGLPVFARYHNNDEATREAFDGEWFRTGDYGFLDDDGFLTITGRKKDIIVTSGGKNVAPATLEDPIRSSSIISEVVVVGEQRPFIAALVTLDPEMLPRWLAAHGEDASMPIAKASQNPRVLEEIQAAVDRANERVSRAESIRKFVVLEDQFDLDKGELTPKMSIIRSKILENYAPTIDAMYTAAPPTTGISLR